MADTAKMTLYVTGARTSSTVKVRTTGRYASLQVNGLDIDLLNQPLFPTTDDTTFWKAVLAAVQARLATLES